MRRMYSEKQIKNLIEEDLSNVVITKGKYTTDVAIRITKVGHCITITGGFSFNNTSEESQTLTVCDIKNLPISNVDGQNFVLVQDINSVISFAHGTLNLIEENNFSIDIDDVPTGESYYNFDVDFIDGSYLPVEDYPGE